MSGAPWRTPQSTWWFVKVVLGVFPGVNVLVVDPEVLAELLQLAVAAAHAGKALLLVGRLHRKVPLRGHCEEVREEAV